MITNWYYYLLKSCHANSLWWRIFSLNFWNIYIKNSINPLFLNYIMSLYVFWGMKNKKHSVYWFVHCVNWKHWPTMICHININWYHNLIILCNVDIQWWVILIFFYKIKFLKIIAKFPIIFKIGQLFLPFLS